MPGSDFASAELINNWDRRDESFDAGEEHYYRFVITNASNFVSIQLVENEGSVGNDERATVYDVTETEIAAPTAEGHYLEDLAIGTYYIKISEAGTPQALDYFLQTYIEENGVQPAPLHSELSEETPELDAIGAPNVGEEFDVVFESEPPLNQNYTPLSTHEYEEFGLAATKNVTDFKTRNPLVINGINNNRVIGNPGIAQYSIRGIVRKEGSAFANSVVRLYDRASGELIGTTTSDVTGAYAFDVKVDPDFKYFIVAHDEFNAPVLQAVVHDFLDPIIETI